MANSLVTAEDKIPYIHICAYIYAYINACIHAYIYAYIHAYMYAYIYAYIYAYTYVYAYMYAYIHTCKHTHIEHIHAYKRKPQRHTTGLNTHPFQYSPSHLNVVFESSFQNLKQKLERLFCHVSVERDLRAVKKLSKMSRQIEYAVPSIATKK